MAGVFKVPRTVLLPVAAIFLKLTLVILFNRKYVHLFKANYHRIGAPRIGLGDAMYLASSLINHGCDASTYQVSYGSHVVYRARRPIKKGEQLTDCYVISAANGTTRERQLSNLMQQKFICK
jgi:SET domain